MKVVVVLEKRFSATPDGRIWSVGWLDHSFWRRYLDVFDGVRVVARVQPVAEKPEGASQASGDGVEFCPVPHYLGPWEYLKKRGEIIRLMREHVSAADAVILRAPGTLAGLMYEIRVRRGRPYGVEVVGDPFDVFAPGAVKSPLRPLLRWRFPRQLRAICRGAAAASYVTEGVLQRRYPAGSSAFVTSYSSIELADEDFVAGPRTIEAVSDPAKLLFIGSLSQLYKAPDVLIQSVAMLANSRATELTIVGDGRHRGEMTALAGRQGVAENVHFAGTLAPGAQIRAAIDACDLFVLPSRTEGLPRVLIEAMARAVPCIGTSVGGIPELLEADSLVEPDNAQALAKKIDAVLSEPAIMREMSRTQLARAKSFHVRELHPRRSAFYASVHAATLAP